jgi:hypothetical protein
MEDRSPHRVTRVPLPADVEPPLEVFVNGVLQREGVDYELVDGELRFPRALAHEGPLGFWRWFLGAWGIGTYRRDEVVDVRYRRDGRATVAHRLPFRVVDAPA